MTQLHNIAKTQLKQAIQIREQLDSLQEKLEALMAPATVTKRKVTMSPEPNEKIAAAQQAKWMKKIK